MYQKILAVVLGIIITLLYAYNLYFRKTIILNSKRMKKLNNNVIKIDNKCFRIDKSDGKSIN